MTKIQTQLTPLAGAGFVLVMIGVRVWHAQRSEFQNIGFNLMIGAAAFFTVYGHWKLQPHTGRNY